MKNPDVETNPVTSYHLAVRVTHGSRYANVHSGSSWCRYFATLTFILLVYFCFSGLARSQSVSWEPASGTLPKDQVSTIELVFRNCEPSGSVVPLPKVDGLQFGTPSFSSSSSFSFGAGQGRSGQSTKTFTYPVRPSTKEKIVIPEFTVETNAGKVVVPSATFTLGDAVVGRGQMRLEDAANSRFILPDKPVWAGEVFSLTYSLKLIERLSPQLASSPQWEGAPLITEDFPEKPTVEQAARRAQDSFVTVNYSVRAYANQTGAVAMPELKQSVALATGRNVFGLDYSHFSITTAPATLNVKPLPVPAPENFVGAVGNFTFSAKVVPEKVAVGEPVTWTLALSGTGNWPAITKLPSRDVAADFRVVQPRAEKTLQPGKLFDGTLAEDVILIPTKPGSYTLGPIEISVFNPVSGKYETLRAGAITVQVTPGTGPIPVAGSVTPSASPATPTAAVAPPEAPSGIPLDTLPAGDTALAPVPREALFPWIAAAGVWPLLLWGVLAYRRARETDPLRQRREARKQIAQILVKFPRETDSTQTLIEWQHAAAIFWGIDTAAPAANQFSDERWAQLWRESDRVLYRAATPLPEDWLGRAHAALATAPLPRFSPLQMFLAKNLIPFFTLVFALLLVPSIHAETKQTAHAAYVAADFKFAENGWREELRAEPLNWVARYNLSLALSQQDRWGEGAAHAAAAFVQHPDDAAVRWQLNLALRKAGYTPAPLVPFANETPLGNLAELTGPATWQRVLLGGVLICALGVAIAFLRGYRLLGKWSRAVAGAVILAGVGVVVLAIVSLKTYGVLAQDNAAIVWKQGTLYSVPTEADETQQTTPVAAGTVVTLGKDYLGWRHVSFSNGQTGWLRMESLVSLWAVE